MEGDRRGEEQDTENDEQEQCPSQPFDFRANLTMATTYTLPKLPYAYDVREPLFVPFVPRPRVRPCPRAEP